MRPFDMMQFFFKLSLVGRCACLAGDERGAQDEDETGHGQGSRN